MATAYTSIIYIYKGVPLLKGGTEVLYVYQDTAITKLEPFLHRAYLQYYYVRENRRYVRVKCTMPDLEGCNYIAFRNASNGDKWFFGFIDQLVYINDNTVEIDFTIDPFPTYLGDCTYTTRGFIVRNTVPALQDTRGAYLQDDYIPESCGVKFTSLGTNSEYSIRANEVRCYCGISSPDNLPQLAYTSDGTSYYQTGIKLALLTNHNLELIQQNGGVIIGAYMCPNWIEHFVGTENFYYYPVVKSLGSLTVDVLSAMGSFTHQKIRTGLYHKLTLVTNQTSRNYEIEFFNNLSNITFNIIGGMCPCPYIFIYPMNYKGVQHNLPEGLMMKFPAIPISANSVYTNAQKTEDTWNSGMRILSGVSNGAMTGAMMAGAGGPIGTIGGAVVGGAVGLITSAGSSLMDVSKHQQMSQFLAPSLTGSGEPIVASDYTLRAKLLLTSPTDYDLSRVESYMSYYGYSINSEVITTGGGVLNTIDTSDGAYLQTGSDILHGSEADSELNIRLKSGIKIRKHLS